MEFARSGQADIAYEVVGGGSREVLMIHAGVNDRRSWRPLIDHLGEAYRCVAFDMRGFGETQYEPEFGWSLTHDALAVMNAAGLTRPVLVACSLGGLVALDLALAAPERVAGLVLIAPGVRGAPVSELDPESPTVQLSEAIEEADEAGDLDEVVRLETHLWLDGPSAPEGRVSGPVRELFIEMDRASELADDPGEMAEVEDAWPRLGEIAVPALVLTGRLDAEHLQALNPELAARLPGGRFEWLEGVAHVPHLEGDPVTLTTISAFLAELDLPEAKPVPVPVRRARAVTPEDMVWETRPHADDEPARHVTELSEQLEAAQVRANIWRYEPGAAGKRHRHAEQEETFVVLSGTLSLYAGEPAERIDVPAGGVICVPGGTPLQSANHGDVDLVVYAYGYPPDEGAELVFPAAVEPQTRP